ncbi:MAG: Dienelactone hydrolase family protein [uncultured Sphingomonadaceae bacterium]|uniref:Dienelactone hydrolase family protein n=1 Tax=uncultured Sphingomonadaceae bacterium TaxID=169976 RepID=A0A6J4T1C8_9SPHN|nr:MAG: Dienelactone hydrolase family protein [uncultured Sphingomonadaceae bacterium]
MTDIRQACPEQRRRAAIDLYDRYTHEGMDRRAFMTELTRIAGSAAAASALLAGIAASPAAAALTQAADPRLTARRESWALPGGRKMSGYVASPRTGRGRRASVMVIHENRGLNAHIEDVTRRVALAGYHAVAPDFLSSLGGTPPDEHAARDLIGKLDLAQATADGVATLSELKRRRTGNGKAGAVGFCWGGAMVNRLAVNAGAALDAGVPYYGTAPAPAEAARVQAPLLIHLASLDARVNATALPWGEALKAAGKDVLVINHQGANHAFNNDTSAERYDKAAADEAWTQTLAFFKARLA